MRKSRSGGSAKTQRFALYLRCSTDDQAQGDFTTIDTQREICMRFVTEQGGVIAGTYADEGYSGTKLNRPAYRQMLADAEAGKFDAVVVTYMSRLGRGKAYTNAEYDLERLHIAVRTVKETFGDDITGYAAKQFTNLMDGMYPQMVRQWTIAKQEEMARSGFYPGAGIPFGYRTEPVPGMLNRRGDPIKRLVPHPDNAPIVAAAFGIYAETASAKPVRDYLESTTGRAWTYRNVAYLLENDAYLGTMRYREVVKENAHPAIITPEMWDKARAADGRRAPRAPKSNPVDIFAYYLRGLVRCPHCDCAMTPVESYGKTSRVHYYECLRAKKKLSICPVRSVNADTLHSNVLKELERAARSTVRMRALIKEASRDLPTGDNLGVEIAALTRQVRDLDKRMGKVQEAIETDESGAIRLLTQRLAVLSAERTDVASRLHQIEVKAAESRVSLPDAEEIAGAWRRLTEIWATLDHEERTIVLTSIVGKVEVWEKETATVYARLMPPTVAGRDEEFELTLRQGTVAVPIANHPSIKIETLLLRFHPFAKERWAMPKTGTAPYASEPDVSCPQSAL